jgi:hypothetical protein
LLALLASCAAIHSDDGREHLSAEVIPLGDEVLIDEGAPGAAAAVAAAAKEAAKAGAPVSAKSLAPKSPRTGKVKSAPSSTSTSTSSPSTSTASATPPPPPPPAPVPKPAAKPAAKPAGSAKLKLPEVSTENKPTKTNLEDILKDRRTKRKKKEYAAAKKRFEMAQVDKKQSDFVLQESMARLSKLQTRLAEAKSARDAAKQQQKQTEGKIIKAHMDVTVACDDYKKVRKSMKLAKAEVREVKIEQQVAGAWAQSGGGKENLKEATARRTAANERKKNADAMLVAKKLAVEKMKAAALAAKNGCQAKKDALHALHKSLRKADQRFSSAVYDIDQDAHKEEPALEQKAQLTAEAKNAAKEEKLSHETASAAALELEKAGRKATEAEMLAMVRNPKLQLKEALEKVKDFDGLSSKGKPLVAEAGTVAADYKARWAKMPLPSYGGNPILEAEASATVKDTAEVNPVLKAAVNNVQKPGVAAVAAAKSTAAGVMGL